MCFLLAVQITFGAFFCQQILSKAGVFKKKKKWWKNNHNVGFCETQTQAFMSTYGEENYELRGRCSLQLDTPLSPSSDCPALGTCWNIPWLLVQASHMKNQLCMGEFICHILSWYAVQTRQQWDLDLRIEKCYQIPSSAVPVTVTVQCSGLIPNFLSGIVLFVLSKIWQRSFIF